MWSRLLEAAQGPSSANDSSSGQRGLGRLRQGQRVLPVDSNGSQNSSRGFQSQGSGGGLPLKELDSFHSDLSLEGLTIGQAAATANAAAAFLRPVSKRRKGGAPVKDTSDDYLQLKQENIQLQRQLVVVTAESEATQKVVDILVDQGDQLRLEREAIRCVGRASVNAAVELFDENRAVAETFAAKLLAFKVIRLTSLDIFQAFIAERVEKLKQEVKTSREECDRERLAKQVLEKESENTALALTGAEARAVKEAKGKADAVEKAAAGMVQVAEAQEEVEKLMREVAKANHMADKARAAAASAINDAEEKEAAAAAATEKARKSADAREKKAAESIEVMQQALEQETRRADEEAKAAALALEAAEKAEEALRRAVENDRQCEPREVQFQENGDEVVDDDATVDTYCEEDDTLSVATEATDHGFSRGFSRGYSRGLSRGFSEVNTMVDTFVEEEPVGEQYVEAENPESLLLRRESSRFEIDEGEEIKQVWISPNAQDGQDASSEYWE